MAILSMVGGFFPQAAAAQGGSGICDRTEQVRNAILAAVSGVGDCADITATHLGQVTVIYLPADNITTLKAGDFAGLTALDSLNLAFNHLKKLPPKVFDGLTSLSFLQLGGNDLVRLPNRVFAGLTSLMTLGLRENPGYPFGPTARAGPAHNVGADTEVTLTGSSGGDPWGRSVTYSWSQTDETGVVVPLKDANTASATLTSPAVKETVRLDFTLAVTAVNPGGTAPPGTTSDGDVGLDTAYVHVLAADPVTVSFVARDYTATEGGSVATVGIRLNTIPRRTVSIPLVAVPAGGADAGDYTVPDSVTFTFADRVKYFSVTATDDDVDDDGERVTVGFAASLPVAVTAGSPATVDVALADNDDPVGVSIDDFAITSDPGEDGLYAAGDVIEVTATYSEAVTVAGQPRLILSVGTHVTELLGQAARHAGYARGSGTENLVFAYPVSDGDSDPDGVSIPEGDLILNGGTVQAGGGVDVLLGHDGLGAQSGHKVDAVVPVLSEAFVNGARLTLRYTEPLDESSVPAGSAFRIEVDGVGRDVVEVGIDEKLVTLTLASAAQPGEAVTAGYTAPDTDPIRDRAGLAAASFASQAVTNYSDPGVSIRAIDPAVYEGEDIDFRLVRNGPASRSLQVTVQVDESGDVLDAAPGSKRVTFAAGDSTAWLTLATHDDHGYEDHSTVTATVAGGGAYIVSETHRSASVTVSDNDNPAIEVTLAAPDSVDEGARNFTVVVSASTVSDTEPHGGVSVRIESTDGTATSGQGGDYGAVDEAVRFLPSDYERVVTGGAGRYVATIEHRVAVRNDGIEEDDETFSLALTRSYVIGDKVRLPAEPHVVTIVDDDDAERPEISVTPIVLFLHEGESDDYRVRLKSRPSGPVTVTVGGWSDTDVSVEPASLDFTPSSWNNARTVTVTAEQDDDTDNDEVRLTHGLNADDASHGPTVKVTVADDDVALPRLSLRALTDSVREGEYFHLEVTRTGPVDRTLRAGVIVWDLDDHVADAWVAAYFRQGEVSDTVSYWAAVDTLVTTDRTIRVAVNPYLDGYEVGSPSEAEIHVIDRTSGTGGDLAPGVEVSFGAGPGTVVEGGAGVPVTVRLSEPAVDAVTIPLVGRGVRGAGEADWEMASEVAIGAGESEGTVLLSAVDDSDEDPGESIELRFGTLPQGHTATEPRSVAVEIEDDDVFVMGTEETRSWLARFGRSVSVDAVDAVRARMAGGPGRSAGSRVTVGGHDLGAWKSEVLSGRGMSSSDPAGSGAGYLPAQPNGAPGHFFRRLFAGTSFVHTGALGQDPAAQWSVWGRGGVSGFGGRDGALSLSGDLTSVTLGADYGAGRTLGGILLSHHRADGTLTGGDGLTGQLDATLTAAYPWLSYSLTDRLSVWGMGGYGTGSMPPSPGSAVVDADIGMRMGAVGATGQLVAARSLTLSLATDAMFTQTAASGAAAPEDVEAEASRVRVILEGSSSFEMAGGTLRPAFEAGLRQDGGDAETGAGLEVGGGFSYSRPSLGLTVEARARGLIAHEDAGYEEWGAHGSVRISPDPSGRGLSMYLSPTWGSAVGGGAHALWSRRDMAGVVAGGGGARESDGGSVALELGYGVALSDGIVATPYGGTLNGAPRVGLDIRARRALEVRLESMERSGRRELLLKLGYRPE